MEILFHNAYDNYENYSLTRPTMSLRKPNILRLVCLCLCIVSSYAETDTLKQGHQLKYGEFLVSAGQVFTLGFFSPQEEEITSYLNPENVFVGIWYTGSSSRNPVWVANRDNPVSRTSGAIEISSSRNPVWVANRDNPVSRTSGAIEIDSKGDFKISDDNTLTSIILSKKRQGSFRTEVAAVLTDTGNFILREVRSDVILWQSFDFPTNVLLPGMKLGFNFKTGQNRSLTSWLSSIVPALGPYTLGADPNRTNQLILWRRGEIHWKSGNWHNGKFMNLKDILYIFDYVSNKDEMYFVLSTRNTQYVNFPMYQIDVSGVINNVMGYRKDGNPSYSEVISCKGPWHMPAGCVGLPGCRKNSRERWFERTKGYMTSDGFCYDKSGYVLGLDDCEMLCLKNCSCVAYSYIYPNQTGCEIWSNVTQLVEDYYGYRDFYILRKQSNVNAKTSDWIWFIVGTAIFMVVLTLAWFGYRMKTVLLTIARFICLLCFFLQQSIRANLLRYYNHIQKRIETGGMTLSNLNSSSAKFQRKKKDAAFVKKSQGILVFSFESMAQATDNFAPSNVLGQGGYGTVYKGLLEDEQEIAIKRLSKSSNQGNLEFMNELKLVAKLQHNNLVTLIGCCIERGEKIVVYEFMPNKSLDFFLFDTVRRLLLDWKQRFNIIEGVAQGLLYLHKYSRLKIIHRDLKTGNILLGEDMNPKISDFGMARLFEQNESGANTKRIVGTRGYMPPEYALEGYFSVKTDVFSFGVLILEIISSKKNNGTYSPDHPLNLMGHAWELWRENRGSEFIDNTLVLSLLEREEAMKCINIGLLCVQEHASDRPTMSTVVGMISIEAPQLPTPKKPAFFFDNGECSRYDLEQGSLNDASISEMEAR